MSRRNISKKRFSQPDSTYNSYLVSLLITRILKSGKKTLAQNIIKGAFEIIKDKTKEDPLFIFEKAIKNASPVIEVKARRVGGSTYQVPVEVSARRGSALALKWLKTSIENIKSKDLASKITVVILESLENKGWAAKKKEEVFKMAEANKAFAHYKW